MPLLPPELRKTFGSQEKATVLPSLSSKYHTVPGKRGKVCEKTEATLQQAQYCFLAYLAQPTARFQMYGQLHNMGRLIAAKLSVYLVLVSYVSCGADDLTGSEQTIISFPLVSNTILR